MTTSTLTKDTKGTKTLFIDIDRLVPLWPEVRKDGITPAGFHNVHNGNKPCFSTKVNGKVFWCFYIPICSVTDEAKARAIFEQVISMITEEHYHSHQVTIKLGGMTIKLRLEIASASVLIRII